MKDLKFEANMGQKPKKVMKRRKLKNKWKTDKKYRHEFLKEPTYDINAHKFQEKIESI